MRLKDRVAVVTGGSRGIGRAISLRLAEEGAAVCVNYVSNERAADGVVQIINAAGGRAFAFKTHVADKAGVDAMVAETVRRYGRVDILVNNAGVCRFLDFFETSEEDWDWHQAINCKGIFLCSQAAAREMRKQGGGRIVNVTSISGEKATNPRQVAYCASKGGANMLTQIMAVALAPYNVTVNAVLPGTIETDINREMLKADDAAVEKGICEVTPLGCLGKPENIAEAVVYFACDRADWTTGSLLVVDGGFML